MLRWFEVVYRFSTYAIISFWIDDKTEHNSVKITMKLATREQQGRMDERRDESTKGIPSRHQEAVRPIKEVKPD